MANYFKINGKDFSNLVSGLKVGKETLVSDNSGRNAAGNTVIDVINEKYKVYVTLRHTTEAEMDSFLDAIKNYVVSTEFKNPFSGGSIKAITAYHGTPEPEYYTIQPDNVIYKPMSINFIEL